VADFLQLHFWMQRASSRNLHGCMILYVCVLKIACGEGGFAKTADPAVPSGPDYMYLGF
jgi:hypothetical protein